MFQYNSSIFNIKKFLGYFLPFIFTIAFVSPLQMRAGGRDLYFLFAGTERLLNPKQVIDIERKNSPEKIEDEERAKKYGLRDFFIDSKQGAGFRISKPFYEKSNSYWMMQAAGGAQPIDQFFNTALGYRRLLWRSKKSPLLFSSGVILPGYSPEKLHWLTEIQLSRFQISHNFLINSFLSKLIRETSSLFSTENLISVAWNQGTENSILKKILENSNTSFYWSLKKNLLGCFFRYGDRERLRNPAYHDLTPPPKIDIEAPLIPVLKSIQYYFEFYGPNYLLNLQCLPEVGIRLSLFARISVEFTTRGFGLRFHTKWKKDPMLNVSAEKSFQSYMPLMQDSYLLCGKSFNQDVSRRYRNSSSRDSYFGHFRAITEAALCVFLETALTPDEVGVYHHHQSYHQNTIVNQQHTTTLNNIVTPSP